MKTPVAFLIYNRPDLAERVFAEIRMARPPVMLIVADGPRDEEDREKCEKTRAVVENIDWPCEVERNYSAVNLGCRKRVSSGLDWVFNRAEEAIILEDDCLPHPTFFEFCDVLLDYYREDERVGHIGGTDYNRGSHRGSASYYFSRYTSIWGWATWRRAWKDYDVDMREWPELRHRQAHQEMFGFSEEAEHFEHVWDDIFSGEIDTWDGQWLLACRRTGRLAIAPNGNLISNLGCRADASHTVDEMHPFAELGLAGMSFPVIYSENFEPDDEADLDRARTEFLVERGGFQRLMSKLGSRHFYGGLIRQVPVLGRAWVRIRSGRTRPPDGYHPDRGEHRSSN